MSTETVTSGHVPERRSARSVLKWVLLIALVTFFAGLLFGYDQGRQWGVVHYLFEKR